MIREPREHPGRGFTINNKGMLTIKGFHEGGCLYWGARLRPPPLTPGLPRQDEEERKARAAKKAAEPEVVEVSEDGGFDLDDAPAEVCSAMCSVVYSATCRR